MRRSSRLFQPVDRLSRFSGFGAIRILLRIAHEHTHCCTVWQHLHSKLRGSNRAMSPNENRLIYNVPSSVVLPCTLLWPVVFAFRSIHLVLLAQPSCEKPAYLRVSYMYAD